MKGKWMNRFAAAGIAVALIFALLITYFPNVLKIEASGISFEYEDSLFDKDKIMTVNIIMDDDQWEDMLANAISENYYSCDIQINGTTYKNVGIRPKGNTSLSQIASDDTTDRYSFKIEFDQYVSGQTCMGLDKLVLNNLMADATYMKEYICYDIFNYLGVTSSLYSYASISVNGENWGLYLAFEAVEESFAARNYGSSYGQLYKPETMEMGGGNMEDMSERMQNMKGMFENSEIPDMSEMPDISGMPNMTNMPDMSQKEEGQMMPPSGMMNEIPDDTVQNMDSESTDSTTTATPNNQDTGEEAAAGGNGKRIKIMGGRISGGSGADLAYIDDEISSYSAIFESAVFNNASDTDFERVIESLKHLADVEDLEEYIDVDEMLRYIAANVLLSL